MQDCLCPVCYAPVDVTRPLGCSSCQTPHHEECFRFAGSCGIFGCGGQEFTTIRPVGASGDWSIEDTGIAPPPAEEPQAAFRFNRAIWWRIVDAWRCQGTNFRLTLTMSLICALAPAAAGALLMLTPFDVQQHLRERLPESFVLFGHGARFYLGLLLGFVTTTGLVPMLCGAALQILLTSRAQGKERSAGELVGMLARRFLRLAGTCFRTFLWMFGPVLVGFFGLGVLTPVAGKLVTGLMFLLAIPLAGCWVFYQAGLLSLSWLVAVMGEDEAGDPLARSRELVRVDFWHVVLGIHSAMALTVAAASAVLAAFRYVPHDIGFGPRFLLEYGALTGFYFVAFSLTFYYVLQYLECRRAVDRDAFRFAGSIYTGGTRQTACRRAPHNVFAACFAGLATVAAGVGFGLIAFTDSNVRSQFLLLLGQDREALELLAPDVARGVPDSLNRAAWILATSSHAELHDGERAVGLASRAVAKRPGSAAFRDTLAAAHARAGHFPQAEAEQRSAVAMLTKQSQLPGHAHYASQIPDFQSRVELFASGQAYVDTRAQELRERREKRLAPRPACSGETRGMNH